MSTNNKIAWLESQYLYPHHFQQQERYLEYILEQRSKAIQPFIYGFSKLKVNDEQLQEGKFSLNNATGIMPDGCPFETLTNANNPLPKTLAPGTRGQLIYIALPNYQEGYQYITTDKNSQQVGRYMLEDAEAYDYSSSELSPERIEVGRLHLRFMLEKEDFGGFTCLPVAKIVEVTPENAIILDKTFIPPMLNIKGYGVLHKFLEHVSGLVKQRANALAIRFKNDEGGSSSAIADFLLLQVLNRIDPKLDHIIKIADKVHPERLYNEFLGLMGELSTFTQEEKRPLQVNDYNHDDLYNCFQMLVANINTHLSSVLEQTAIQMTVEKRQYGIYVSPINDSSLIGDSRFVLAIRASMQTNTLKEYLPSHVKIGSVNTIRDLVNNQLTGVPINALPIAPREITYHSGFVYFELDQSSDHWQNMKGAAGFAFHIAGELTELEVEFWAIRT